MPLEVIHGDERQAARPRNRLRCREADEERADQTWALRDGNALDVVERLAGRRERLANDRRHELEMATGCDLGDDTAEARVEVGLRRHDRREHAAFGCDQSRSSLVARRLDPEDHEACSVLSGSRHMMSASSRLSV